MLDTADRQEDRVAEMRVNRLSDRLEALRRQIWQLQAMERAVAEVWRIREAMAVGAFIRRWFDGS
jgi:hypothetical protein